MRLATAEPARLTADLMGERWRTKDVRSARDFAGGMHANLMHHPPGETSGPPSDAAIVIMPLRGEARHRQWQGGRPSIDGLLPVGACNIIPAGFAPRAVVTQPVRVLHLYVSTAVLGAAWDGGPGAGEEVALVDPQFAADPLLDGPMAALARALDGDEPPARLWLDGVGLAIGDRLVGRWSNHRREPSGQAERTPTSRDWRQRRAVEYLEARLSEDVGLAEVAAAVGLSPRHLTTLFRRAAGVAPHQWLLGRRLERACELLAHPDPTVTEVAHACGFASAQHFATTFRRRLGVAPGAWRRARLS